MPSIESGGKETLETENLKTIVYEYGVKRKEVHDKISQLNKEIKVKSKIGEPTERLEEEKERLWEEYQKIEEILRPAFDSLLNVLPKKELDEWLKNRKLGAPYEQKSQD